MEVTAIAQSRVKADPVCAGVAVDDAREADGVVIVKELAEALQPVFLRRYRIHRLQFHVTVGVPQNSSGFACLWVHLGKTRTAIRDLEMAVDAAERKRERVEQ